MTRRPLYPISLGVADGYAVANSDFSTRSVVNKFKQSRREPYGLRAAVEENSNRIVAAIIADNNNAGGRRRGVSVNLAGSPRDTQRLSLRRLVDTHVITEADL